MSATYKAIEVTKPGLFTEVDRPLRTPGLNEVRIRVEACGVCHTDSMLVNAEIPNLTYPRVNAPIFGDKRDYQLYCCSARFNCIGRNPIEES
jgi:hypothetical protein